MEYISPRVWPVGEEGSPLLGLSLRKSFVFKCLVAYMLDIVHILILLYLLHSLS